MNKVTKRFLSSLLVLTMLMVQVIVQGSIMVQAEGDEYTLNVNFEDGWTDNGSGTVSTTQTEVEAATRSGNNVGEFSIGTDSKNGKYLKSYTTNGNTSEKGIRIFSTSYPETALCQQLG